MKELNFGFFALTLVTIFSVFNTAFSALDPINFKECTINGSEPFESIGVSVFPDPPNSVGNVFGISGDFRFNSEDDSIEFITNKIDQTFKCGKPPTQCDLENDSFDIELTIDLEDHLEIASGQDILTIKINREECNVNR
ncbi:hypothetical protein C2G38_2243043 [Gigaspora rosea]|uniref:Phosphatidylglycerol/phosphatidylinositol transfer protein n=1 Tax=Gigaspora rosea TaxID=44941 RepID=A0A397VUX0_9GLOM|nr:hypothetical protein C2G38_2243043 [Gigaspora rosea]